MIVRASNRGHATTHHRGSTSQDPVLDMERPGVFQCTLLRALELPRAYRDVFLLNQIHGHTPDEIAAILGISIPATELRLKRARREFANLGDSTAIAR